MQIGRSDSWRHNMAFFVLIAFLVLVFLTGGGSRADIQSLVALRPVAILCCVFALATLHYDQIRARRGLLLLAAAIFLLVVVQLIPLPPSIWQSLPGRNLVVEIDRQAGIVDAWRPLTLSPSGTWNVFFSLFPPAAILLLGIQMTRQQLEKLVLVVLGIGLLSGLVGLLQSIGPAQGPLYFYRITNNGAAVGLFSNRNHQAMFLATLFPLLAFYASQRAESGAQAGFRAWAALVASACLIPLLLVTGSRAGLVLGGLSAAISVFLYRAPSAAGSDSKKPRPKWVAWAVVGGGVLLTALVGLMMTRAEAFRRIAEGGVETDLRFQVWKPILGLARENIPAGTGLGSFPTVYQVLEPYGLLVPSYLNHVHNDWLELAVEAGLPGLLLVSAVSVAFVSRGLTIIRAKSDDARTRLLGIAGTIVIAIFAIGSAADYPLRTPSIACLATLAALWMTSGKAVSAAVSRPQKTR